MLFSSAHRFLVCFWLPALLFQLSAKRTLFRAYALSDDNYCTPWLNKLSCGILWISVRLFLTTSSFVKDVIMNDGLGPSANLTYGLSSTFLEILLWCWGLWEGIKRHYFPLGKRVNAKAENQRRVKAAGVFFWGWFQCSAQGKAWRQEQCSWQGVHRCWWACCCWVCTD